MIALACTIGSACAKKGGGGSTAPETTTTTTASTTSPSTGGGTPPSTPTITIPASSPTYSNSTTLTIAGGCTTGNSVHLGGDANATDVTSPAGSLTQLCSASTYSYTLSISVNATYNFTVLQNDGASDSSTATLSWTLDTVAPSAPTVTSPSPATYVSSGNSITIGGTCEANATVNLAGDSTGSTACASNAYSFTINQSSDGIYNFSVSQTDRAGNTSASTAVQWTRDTAAPSAPTITNPGSTPYTSSGNSLTIAGGCENGTTVNLAGSATASTTCASSAYSFTDNQTVDNTYNYSVTQTDAAGNVSPAATLQWVRDSSIPPTPTITSPAINPFYSNLSSLTISGGCVTGYTVTLGGVAAAAVTNPAGSLTQACAGSAYSFTIAESSDATYTLAVKQNNGITDSANATLQWMRDTSAPATPTLTSPASSPYYSNGNSLIISGTCEAGATVNLGGAATGSTSCSSLAYSFTLSNSSDGSYDYTISQTDAAGNVSGIRNFTWIRDTAAPASPTITGPSSNPFTSGDTTITISGACETGATVTLSGDTAATTTCSLSAYSFSTTKNADATYNYSLTQTDLAGNVSAAQAFQWVRDTTIPATPVVSSPSIFPYYTNGNSITISGSCITGYLVNLSGDATGQVTCASSAFSFTVNNSSDGTYNYGVDQQATSATPNSAQATVRWIRDTSTPATPTITTPSTSPYTSAGDLTIAGSCESGATVTLSGDDAQTFTCAGSVYTFTVTKAIDGTYNFSIRQTDKAGNNSASATLQWVRNTSIPATPTITTPSVTPYASNGSSLTIAGGCVTGNTVTLGGDVVAGDVTTPAGSLTTICASSSYQFVIAKSSDATYNFTITQSGVGGTSGAATQTWARDTTAPSVSITSSPSATNLALTAAFAFSSTDTTATFECSLDAAAYSTCSSPITYSGLANGSHTFNVRAKDSVGNVTASPASYTWSQAAYNTTALYHFTSGASTSDSSSYTGAEKNNLTNSGTTNTASGKFADGESFAAASTQYMNVTTNNSQQLGVSTMTLEAFVKFSSLPASNGDIQIIASKNGTAGNYGWEFGLKRQGSNYLVAFTTSINGTTVTTKTSTSCTMDTTSFHHLAVTWNKGSVKFFCDGTAKGSATIGTAGSSVIFKSTADLILGKTQNMAGANKYLNGVIDEFRMSSIVRWTASFTPPTGAYSAD